MFRQLDYQDRVLTALDTYLNILKDRKKHADKIADLAINNPDLNLSIPDFTEEAWEKMKADGKLPASRNSIPFSLRTDGCNRPVPNVVLKVPTGGGKTWLAVLGVSRIMGQYLNCNAGFVLWIVPNEVIYTQTLKHLKDRQHPYRQALDRAAAGRVRIMEKTDPVDARDIETNLCIMLLMFQSSNRQNQDSLKMFQDRGDVHNFFPAEGEQQAHGAALKQTPNLFVYKGMFPMVMDSLSNALKIIRPVVVLDEGHRAISDLAFKTLYDLNPCFVLELSATPQDVQMRRGPNPRPARYANVLVEVTGRELDVEGMIKMPLNLDPRQGINWTHTLGAALIKLNALDTAARQFCADTNRYIRPIMLVQVERTGADQRGSGYIHAEDVKDWLLMAGFDIGEIVIKTAEQNDLNNPENQNLLSQTNRVRIIITKQALQEGWDCPFAYVLCGLAASSNLKSMTQLVGRILRQPGAMKTGVAALDECYVVTHHANTADVVVAIKEALEQDGLGDFVLQITQGNVLGNAQVIHKINRRSVFASTKIYLPKVMIVDQDEVRDLDYETDVLSAIDWRYFDPKDIAARIPVNAQAAESQLQRIRVSENGDDPFVGETVSENPETLAFDPVHAVRMISDIVPNTFVGREIVGRLIDALYVRGFDDAKLGKLATLIVEELHKGLDAVRLEKAEAFFKTQVVAGYIQFHLRLDGRNWLMPDSIESTVSQNARQVLSNTGGPLNKSLFVSIYEDELNNDERDVAVYLDAEKTLIWWHRNAARTQYGIQGWKKAKIYPDFIFAVQGEGVTKRITILETKGDQLDNLDTAYKREVLFFLFGVFKRDNSTLVGELDLFTSTDETNEIVQGILILMSEWKTELPKHLAYR